MNEYNIQFDDLRKELEEFPNIGSDRNIAKLKNYLKDDTITKNVNLVIMIHLNLAENFYKLARYNKALLHTQNALRYAYDIMDWKKCIKGQLLLGNINLELKFTDLSLKSYLEVTRLSKLHNYVSFYCMGLNNIGELYYSLSDMNKAYLYYKEAHDVFKKQGAGGEKYHKIRFIHTVNLAIVTFKLGRFMEAHDYNRQAHYYEGQVDKLVYQSFISYLDFMMLTYNGSLSDVVGAYSTAKKTLLKNQYYPSYVDSVVMLCRFYLDKKSVNDFLLDEIKALDVAFYCEQYSKEILNVYRLIIQYYKSVDDSANALIFQKKYYTMFREVQKKSKLQQFKLVEFRMNISNVRNERKIIENKQNILNQKKYEALQKRELLESINTRFNIINKIGRKLTSTLEIDEIMSYTYEEIKAYFPVDSYFLFIVDEQNRQLIPVTIYEREEMVKLSPIPFDDQISIFAMCHRKGMSIFSNDLFTDFPYLKKHSYRLGEDDASSIILLPIEVDNQIIAYCSVQSAEKSDYTEEHKLLFEAIMPFIGISIKNSMESRRLQFQIEERQKSQVELKKLNRELKMMSEIDGLTHIANRHYFDREYDALVKLAEEQQMTLTVMMIDIDYFKNYNDFYGHIKGDEVLVKVVRLIEHSYRREHSIFARYGGEEFVMVFAGVSFLEAQSIGERLKSVVEEANILHEKSPLHHLTISIGISFYHNVKYKYLHKYIQSADTYLYKAKAEGRNQVQIKNE